jgi:hypothetical protein
MRYRYKKLGLGVTYENGCQAGTPFLSRSGDGGPGVTIRASAMRFGNQVLAQRPGDASSRHPGLCNSSGEGTR